MCFLDVFKKKKVTKCVGEDVETEIKIKVYYDISGRKIDGIFIGSEKIDFEYCSGNFGYNIYLGNDDILLHDEIERKLQLEEIRYWGRSLWIVGKHELSKGNGVPSDVLREMEKAFNYINRKQG